MTRVQLTRVQRWVRRLRVMALTQQFIRRQRAYRKPLVVVRPHSPHEVLCDPHLFTPRKPLPGSLTYRDIS